MGSPGIICITMKTTVKSKNNIRIAKEILVTIYLPAPILHPKSLDFNECFELYIWRYGKDFCYRIREDGRGEPVNIYEEEHIVWGTGVENDAGGIRLIEDRVTPIKFPYRIKKGDLPIKYRIRNYFDFDRDGLIRFYDARLVEFIDRKGEKLNG